jgi:hypothetical protein
MQYLLFGPFVLNEWFKFKQQTKEKKANHLDGVHRVAIRVKSD